MINLLLAAAIASSSPTCVKLSKDFENNERGYATTRQLYKRWYDIEQTAYLMAPDAAGLRDIAAAKARLDATDKDYLDSGDRIITLMTGHKCPLPDHVTSWTTYSPSEASQSRSSGNSGTGSEPSGTAATPTSPAPKPAHRWWDLAD